MSLKASLIATAIWTLLIVPLAIAAIWYVVTHPLPGVDQEARADKLGQSMGFLAGIGYGLIWIPFAMRWGKERRAARLKSSGRE